MEELPPLIFDGISTPLEKLTQTKLRSLIYSLLRYSIGRGAKYSGAKSNRPLWWPKGLAYQNVRTDFRSEDEKEKTPWTHVLRQIVINCYKFHGREDLLATVPEDDEKANTCATPNAYNFKRKSSQLDLKTEPDSTSPEAETPRKKRLQIKLVRHEEKIKAKSRANKIHKKKDVSLKRKRNGVKELNNKTFISSEEIYEKKAVSLKRNGVKELNKKNKNSSKKMLMLDSMKLNNKSPNKTHKLSKRKSKMRSEYSPMSRKIAVALCFSSPKGYHYVRQCFDNCLPHRSTIGKWFKNINAEPDFGKEGYAIKNIS